MKNNFYHKHMYEHFAELLMLVLYRQQQTTDRHSTDMRMETMQMNEHSPMHLMSVCTTWS